MASFAIGQSGCRAELPRVRVGVIRQQSETMLSPSHDVVPFLEAERRGRWAVRVFDERDFGGALHAGADFDVIVLGYNATVYTPELRAALREAPPTVPILVLHQRDQHCFGFLRNELELEVVTLGDGVREAVIPRERAVSFEPLLSWPNAGLTPDGRLAVKAIRALSFTPDSAWRLVVEARRGAQRLPVLIRTRSDHRQRIVACSLLLRPAAQEAHGRLLENLLVYCAFGWPDVGLVELDGDAGSIPRVRDLELGMGMWSERSVRVTVPRAAVLPLDAWPLRGVKRIVAPEELSPDGIDALESARTWFRRGGELIRVGADRKVTVNAELTDRFIVLREWASWFGALAEPVWLGRLSPARAVLRMLEDAGRGDGSNLADDIRFRVEPSEYEDEIARLLASRLQGNNVDETISATAAALDLDRLIGERGLSPFKRLMVRYWLKEQLDGASRADQLDILRCLADADLLKDYIAKWGGEWGTTKAYHRVDALVATHLREAVHACWPDGGEPEDLLPPAALDALDGEHVAENLRHAPLLCADFLTALYSRRPGAAGATSPVFDPARFPESVAVAVDSISARGLYTDTSDVRAVCAHTQAIFRHLERHPAGLRFLATRGELPSSAAESVLQEATRARHSEREARRDLPALGKAVLVFGTVTLGLAAVGLLDLWRVSGISVSVRPWWLVAPAIIVPACALATLRWKVLPRLKRGEEERWDLLLSQNTMAVAALALALVPATFAWRLGAPGGGVTAAALGLAPITFATALALLLAALRHFELVSDWVTRVPDAFADIRSPLAFLTKRREPRSGGTSPPSRAAR